MNDESQIEKDLSEINDLLRSAANCKLSHRKGFCKKKNNKQTKNNNTSKQTK